MGSSQARAEVVSAPSAQRIHRRSEMPSSLAASGSRHNLAHVVPGRAETGRRAALAPRAASEAVPKGGEDDCARSPTWLVLGRMSAASAKTRTERVSSHMDTWSRQPKCRYSPLPTSRPNSAGARGMVAFMTWRSRSPPLATGEPNRL